MRLTNLISHPLFDFPIRLVEVVSRQIYWRSTRLQKLRKKTKVVEPKYLDLKKLEKFYSEIGITSGINLMVHSKIEGLILLDENNQETKQLRLATKVLEMFQNLIGANGTLSMPAHPLYKQDPGFMHDKRDLALTFDIKKTPSKVGILTEIFRRQKGVKRSRHPLSSLCAYGPNAEYLVENNLNDDEPLPHGNYSSYYRFAEIGGKIVSLNIPLIKALSIVHCAEEIKDSNWPVKSFFYRRKFCIKDGESVSDVIVREKDPKWVRFISLKQLQRDLVRAGILKEHIMDGIRIDLADAREVIEYMSLRNRNSTYPYFFIPKILYK